MATTIDPVSSTYLVDDAIDKLDFGFGAQSKSSRSIPIIEPVSSQIEANSPVTPNQIQETYVFEKKIPKWRILLREGVFFVFFVFFVLALNLIVNPGMSLSDFLVRLFDGLAQLFR